MSTGSQLSRTSPLAEHTVREAISFAADAGRFPEPASLAILVVRLDALFDVIGMLGRNPFGVLPEPDPRRAVRVVCCSPKAARDAFGLDHRSLPDRGGPYVLLVDDPRFPPRIARAGVASQ